MIALIAILTLVYFTDHETISNLYFPFFKKPNFKYGFIFIPFGIFVIIGSSNAVNLTDGLDGLLNRSSYVSCSIIFTYMLSSG